MWLLLKENVIEDNLKQHGKELPQKAKLVKGQKRWRPLRLRKNVLRTKSKHAIMEKNWILSAVMFKRKKVRIVRILASISKSENSAKPPIVIASSTETASAKENQKNLDKILKEISKLNSRFLSEVKLHKQVN